MTLFDSRGQAIEPSNNVPAGDNVPTATVQAMINAALTAQRTAFEATLARMTTPQTGTTPARVSQSNGRTAINAVNGVEVAMNKALVSYFHPHTSQSRKNASLSQWLGKDPTAYASLSRNASFLADMLAADAQCYHGLTPFDLPLNIPAYGIALQGTTYYAYAVANGRLAVVHVYQAAYPATDALKHCRDLVGNGDNVTPTTPTAPTAPTAPTVPMAPTATPPTSPLAAKVGAIVTKASKTA